MKLEVTTTNDNGQYTLSYLLVTLPRDKLRSSRCSSGGGGGGGDGGGGGGVGGGGGGYGGGGCEFGVVWEYEDYKFGADNGG